MKILAGVGVILIVLLVLIIALPFLIDLNKYQDRYRPIIEQALNRKVALKDIRLTIWPRIGARVDGFTVQDDPAFRSGPFASLSSLDVGVKLLPLLSGKVEVEEVTLRDPVISVLKNKNGVLNVSTIGPPTVAPPKPEGPLPQPTRNPLQALALLAVDRVSIEGGKLTYRDESSPKPTEYVVNDLDFLLTSVHLGESPSLHVAATVLPYNIPVTLDGTFGPLVETFAMKSFEFVLAAGKLAAGLKGSALDGNLDVTLTSDSLNTADLPVATPLTKPVQVKDLHVTVHAFYPLPPDGPLEVLEIRDLGLALVMGSSSINIKGTASKGIANLTAASAHILSSDLPIAFPFKKPVEIKDLHVSARAKYPPKQGAPPLELADVTDLGFTVAMGASRLESKGTVIGGFAKITASSKALNSVDLPIALPLKKPVEIRDLQVAGEMKGPEARLTALSLQIFNGLVRGQGTVDIASASPPFSGKVSLQSLQLGPALQALGTDEVTMSGTASGDVALAGRGFSQADLTKALEGSGHVAVKEGRLEGINLLQQAAALLKVAGVSLDDVKATAFSTIESDVALKQGLVTVQRLLMDSHDYQATGGGTIGLDQSLNLKLNLNLSQALSQKIGSGSPIAKIAMSGGRLSLPLVITGSMQAPVYGLDTKILAGKVQEQVQEKVRGAVEDVLQGKAKPDDLKQQGKELLKGLLGR
jgi:AsmA protein